MPAESCYLRQVHPSLPIVLVEKTELNSFGDFRINREVGPDPIEVCSQWIRLAGPRLHVRTTLFATNANPGRQNTMPTLLLTCVIILCQISAEDNSGNFSLPFRRTPIKSRPPHCFPATLLKAVLNLETMIPRTFPADRATRTLKSSSPKQLATILL